MPNPFLTHPTLASIGALALLFAALIYLPPLFDTPEEAVRRSQKECGWAIRTGSSVESKCRPFATKAQAYLPGAPPGPAGDAWMQLAEYRLVQGDVPASKQACRQPMSSYGQLDESAARLSNARNARTICDALFAEHGS